MTKKNNVPSWGAFVCVSTKTNSMSHIENVQAFEKLIGICTGLEGSYIPGQQSLQVSGMKSTLAKTRLAMEEVVKAQIVFETACGTRERLYEHLSKLTSRVYHVLKSSGCHALDLENAARHSRQVRAAYPRRKKVTVQPGEEEVKPRTFGFGGDYINRVSAFDMLIRLVSCRPTYQPNEIELAIESLWQTSQQIKDANRALMKAEIKLSSSRAERDKSMYLEESSLVRTARAARHYIRGIFGLQSLAHQQVSKLTFTSL